MNPQTLASIGLILIFAGTAIIILALLALSLRSIKGKNVNAGGVIVVGPFPIAFGTNRELVKNLLKLSIILTILAIALFIILMLLS